MGQRLHKEVNYTKCLGVTIQRDEKNKAKISNSIKNVLRTQQKKSNMSLTF